MEVVGAERLVEPLQLHTKGRWVTGLWGLGECEKAYSSFLGGDDSVNVWRMFASLGRLSQADEREFVAWARNPKNKPDGFGEAFAASCVSIGRNMRYMPACELWESLSGPSKRLDRLNNEFRVSCMSQRQRDFWCRMVDVAAEHNLMAHGTRNTLFVSCRYDFLDKLKKMKTVNRIVYQGEVTDDATFLRMMRQNNILENHWAMLNIMLQGKMRGSEYGPLSFEHNGPDDSLMWGPHYVILHPSVNERNRWTRSTVGARHHMIYLEPNQDGVQFLTEGVEKAAELDLTSHENAKQSASKVMTYQELVENRDRIPDLIAGKATPAKLAGRS